MERTGIRCCLASFFGGEANECHLSTMIGVKSDVDGVNFEVGSELCGRRFVGESDYMAVEEVAAAGEWSVSSRRRSGL